MSDSRYGETGTGESFAKIEACRITFDIRAQCNDDFFDGFGRKAFFKYADAEVFRLDAVQGRNFTAEDVVFATECARFFDADNINGPLDYANQGTVSPRIGTYVAGRFFGQGAANLTQLNAFPSIQDSFGQLLNGKTKWLQARRTWVR